MAERQDLGLWTDPAVPKRDWTCLSVEDLGPDDPELRPLCEMCQSVQIRYVHEMTNVEWPENIKVGCICAGHMQGNLEAARELEGRLRSRATRRDTWLTRRWRRSKKGNSTLKTDGYRITIFGHYKFSVSKLDDVYFSKREYPSEDDAKLAAFDSLYPSWV